VLGLLCVPVACQWSDHERTLDALKDISAAGSAPNSTDIVQTAAFSTAKQPEQPNTPRTEERLRPADLERGARKWTTEKDSNDGVYRVDTTLPSPAAGMTTPTIPAPEKVCPITLSESLRVAGVENPTINIARQAVQIAQAEQLQARVLLVPNVNVGANYDVHNGTFQSSFGAIRKVDRDSVYYGLGVNTVGTQTIQIPGLFINQHLGNVLFEPQVARQALANRRFRATATRNDIFLDVSTTYLDLLGAEARLAVIRQSLNDFEAIARWTASYARTGAGRQGDADRAQADLLALRYQEQKAQQEVAEAAANLAELLNLDPSCRLQTGDVPIQIVQFVDPKVPLPRLLDIASQNRPEVLAAMAAIRQAQIRVRQEKTRPLFPILVTGFSAGNFGGGSVGTSFGNVFNPHTGQTPNAATPETLGRIIPPFGNIAGRYDFDVFAFWQLQNMGFGNIARVRETRALVGQSEAERLRVLNEVLREVSEAYNKSAEYYRSIAIQRRRVQEATNGLQKDLNRIYKGQGLTIEVLDNARRLLEAREALLAAVVNFDRSQFQLFVALGQPPTLVVEDDKPPLPPPPVEPIPPTN
jgi:outer membrane protein TolC